VGIKEINAMESLMRTCVDCSKVVAEVEAQPSDLGTARMHKYLIAK
jgi:hypothetical protein